MGDGWSVGAAALGLAADVDLASSSFTRETRADTVGVAAWSASTRETSADMVVADEELASSASTREISAGILGADAALASSESTRKISAETSGAAASSDGGTAANSGAL